MDQDRREVKAEDESSLQERRQGDQKLKQHMNQEEGIMHEAKCSCGEDARKQSCRHDKDKNM